MVVMLFIWVGVLCVIGFCDVYDFGEYLVVIVGVVGVGVFVLLYVYIECLMGDVFGLMVCCCGEEFNGVLVRMLV